MKKLSLTQILLGAVVLYVLYRMFYVREGMTPSEWGSFAGIIIVAVLLVGGMFYIIIKPMLNPSQSV